MAERHGDAKGQKAGGHTEADGGHGGNFPPFDSSTFASQLVSLLIAFVALYLIVSRIALPRVGGLLDKRQNAIEGDQQRHQLRSKGVLLERRKRASMGISFAVGSRALGVPMTFSHGLLLFG